MTKHSNALARLLADQIRRDGPMTFHDWMQAALYHPELGYYCRSDRPRWGREGDYRTAPETSPLFAATFVRFFLKLFREAGSPDELAFVEVGAGAGHFAEGLLDTLERQFPEVFERTTYLIDEISNQSRELVATRLAKSADRVRFSRVSDLDAIQWGIIFANELLDALPVHRVALRNGELSELYVNIKDDDSFGWHYGPLSTSSLRGYLERFAIKLSEDQIVEINLHIEKWFSSISSRLLSGHLIIVDYGAESTALYSDRLRNQGTLRAFKRHRSTDDVLSAPGEQDLTTTIDWDAVKEFGREHGFALKEFDRLDQFLLKCGVLEELDELAAKATSEVERLKLRTSLRELILPGGMAESFQVLVLSR